MLVYYKKPMIPVGKHERNLSSAPRGHVPGFQELLVWTAWALSSITKIHAMVLGCAV